MGWRFYHLNQLAQHDDPVTAGEAMTGGFWRVAQLGDERFGLFPMWASPEDGDEPLATLTDRDTALLAAFPSSTVWAGIGALG